MGDGRVPLVRQPAWCRRIAATRRSGGVNSRSTATVAKTIELSSVNRPKCSTSPGSQPAGGGCLRTAREDDAIDCGARVRQEWEAEKRGIADPVSRVEQQADGRFCRVHSRRECDLAGHDSPHPFSRATRNAKQFPACDSLEPADTKQCVAESCRPVRKPARRHQYPPRVLRIHDTILQRRRVRRQWTAQAILVVQAPLGSRYPVAAAGHVACDKNRLAGVRAEQCSERLSSVCPCKCALQRRCLNSGESAMAGLLTLSWCRLAGATALVALVAPTGAGAGGLACGDQARRPDGQQALFALRLPRLPRQGTVRRHAHPQQPVAGRGPAGNLAHGGGRLSRRARRDGQVEYRPTLPAGPAARFPGAHRSCRGNGPCPDGARIQPGPAVLEARARGVGRPSTLDGNKR